MIAPRITALRQVNGRAPMPVPFAWVEERARNMGPYPMGLR
ncbi:hypothetical protein [Roseinatronobacter alkalisoli]|uniref:Uncharacterized protein n=1 Tax=Roseinatronobacter alkalisoli TaxID=3028235 RepID=A0ABT5T559_9RHOB|nr:hypothetical protein [Roseinatronobacter sp. HJB301]MDD7970257.1 hypothetical protein [Roseinatronobacter sp. HJB301]